VGKRFGWGKPGLGACLDSQRSTVHNALDPNVPGLSAAMAWLANLNLIRLFDFYLALVFLASIVLRVRQYEAIVRLVTAVPGRWPRLFELVKKHRTIFLTRATLLPAVLALLLMGAQILASRFIWPDARLTAGHLVETWPAIPVVALLGAAMIGFDVYATWSVAEVNRTEIEGYLDQAEYWLRSWKAPVVSFFTLGFVNPRRMVAREVEKALRDASHAVNETLWWLAIQAGLRIAFGVSLWLTYAFSAQGTQLLANRLTDFAQFTGRLI
jgi:hypothetical protein